MTEDLMTSEHVRSLVAEVGKRLSTTVQYNWDIDYDEMKARVADYLETLGREPTYEEVLDFNGKNGGVNCDMFTYAASDLLRAQGIAAERIVIIDRARKNRDNHSIILAADNWWLEPQTGQTIPKDDWDGLVSKYSKIMNIEPNNMVAFCKRTNTSWSSGDWRLTQ